jgi:hypothetical protein
MPTRKPLSERVGDEAAEKWRYLQAHALIVAHHRDELDRLKSRPIDPSEVLSDREIEEFLQSRL